MDGGEGTEGVSVIIFARREELNESCSRHFLLRAVAASGRGKPVLISSVQHEYKWRIKGSAEGL